MNFCDECHKIVPDNEIKHYPASSFRGEDIPERYMHQYESYENINGPSDGFNCCLANVTVYCGHIREPEDWEYFLYVTWGIPNEKVRD